MIIPTKTASTILNEMIAELKAKSNITNLSAGSIARTLLEIINTQLDAVYSALNINLIQSFVSTASGIYLEYIGRLLGSTRRVGETDNDFRYRITQQYLVFSKANETAIRLSCLAVIGVKDIIIENFFYGTGSFAVRVITDDLIPSQDIIDSVQRIINENKAAGIYAKAISPNILDLNISYSIVFSKSTTESVSALASLLKDEIQVYLDGLGVGGTIDIAYLIRLPYTLTSLALESRILEIKLNEDFIYSRSSYSIPYNSRIRIANIRINNI